MSDTDGSMPGDSSGPPQGGLPVAAGAVQPPPAASGAAAAAAGGPASGGLPRERIAAGCSPAEPTGRHMNSMHQSPQPPGVKNSSLPCTSSREWVNGAQPGDPAHKQCARAAADAANAAAPPAEHRYTVHHPAAASASGKSKHPAEVLETPNKEPEPELEPKLLIPMLSNVEELYEAAAAAPPPPPRQPSARCADVSGDLCSASSAAAPRPPQPPRPAVDLSA